MSLFDAECRCLRLSAHEHDPASSRILASSLFFHEHLGPHSCLDSCAHCIGRVLLGRIEIAVNACKAFLQAYGTEESSFLWEDDEGTTHEIHHEGGESRAMLWVSTPRSVQSSRSSMLTNVFSLSSTTSTPCLIPNTLLKFTHVFLGDDLWAHIRFQINAGETQIWNRGGVVPPGHDALLRAAQIVNPRAKLCHGDLDAPAAEPGVRVLGTPLGHRAYVEAQLQRTRDDHQQLLDGLPLVQNLQSAWLLLLFCAATRANYFLRVVHPFSSESVARQHDTRVRQCFGALLGQLHHPTWKSAAFLCTGSPERSAHCTRGSLGELGRLRHTRMAGSC